MKQTVLVPAYYNEFSCIGPACEDTCCAGWRVTIDKKTYQKYKKVRPSTLKLQIEESVKRTRSNTSFMNYARIEMDEQGACPLLTKEGFCGVHAELGENYLSHTCAVYPRTVNQVDGVLEKSMTMSCPEVARLALTAQEGLAFVEREEEVAAWDELVENTNQPLLWPLRIASIRFLQNRATTLENRLLVLGLFLQKVETVKNELTNESFEQLVQAYEQRLTLPAFLEQVDKMPRNRTFQLALLTTLSNDRIEKGLTHSGFIESIQQVVTGLQLNEDMADDEKVQFYNEAVQHFYKPYDQQYGYILENYVVNMVYKDLFPFNEQTFFASYRKLILYVILLKFNLTGLAAYHKGLNEQQAIQLIQQFGRQVEHNEVYVQSVLKMMDEEAIQTFGHMVALLQ